MSAQGVRSPDWPRYHARGRPNATAVVDLGTGRRFTYAELNERAERLATALSRDFGIAGGDRVAIYSQNNSNIFEVQFACWKLGAAYVPLNWRLAIPELEFIVRDCTPTVLFHEAERAEAAETVATLGDVKARISWDGPSPGAVEYEEVLAAAPHIAFPRHDNTHDTLACVMYTSGTTGHPKGAMITHGGMTWNLLNATAPFAFRTGMVNLTVL